MTTDRTVAHQDQAIAVTLNDFKRQWDEVGEAVRDCTERVGASGWYVLGQEVARFEQELSDYWGIGHAVGVASGMDAIDIGLRCSGISVGDRVVTTPLSAFATTLAVVRSGGVPVFVDVDASGQLDLQRCRRLLQRRGDLRFLLPVHLYGHALDLDELAELRDRFELQVIEDCAQSIGARWATAAAGTVGQVSATSFYPTKNLGALGDGGAVLTSSPVAAEQARALRHYGQTETYRHDLLGLNSRLDELQAAILCDALLPRLDEWTEQRRAAASAYRDGIRNRLIEIPPTPRASVSVWHLFPILVPPGSRAELLAHLQSHGITAGVHYPTLIPHQKALATGVTFEVEGELTTAQRFAECEVSLPVHPFLTAEQIERVITACNSWTGP